MSEDQTAQAPDSPPVNEFEPDRSGPSLMRTIIQLFIASLLVGAVLAMFSVNPVEFWQGIFENIQNFVTSLFSMGWSAVYTIISYVLFGALIVVPVWGVIKLLSARK